MKMKMKMSLCLDSYGMDVLFPNSNKMVAAQMKMRRKKIKMRIELMLEHTK